MQEPSHQREELGKKLDKQIHDIARAELRHKHAVREQKQFQKRMMAEAVGNLYQEKPSVPANSAAAAGKDTRVLNVWRNWDVWMFDVIRCSVSAACHFMMRLIGRARHAKAE